MEKYKFSRDKRLFFAILNKKQKLKKIKQIILAIYKFFNICRNGIIYIVFFHRFSSKLSKCHLDTKNMRQKQWKTKNMGNHKKLCRNIIFLYI